MTNESHNPSLPTVIDLVEQGIVEKHEPHEIVIEPVHFVYQDDNYRSEHACVCYDGIYRAYICPLVWNNWREKPVAWLRGLLVIGGCDIQTMLRRGYVEKRRIRIGNRHVLDWTDYEAVFAASAYYIPPTRRNKARIVENWGGGNRYP